MKILLSLSLPFLLLYFTETFAQQNDNVMVLGYRYGTNGPIPKLDFSYGDPDTGVYYSPIDIFLGNASICDSNGIMMMYTNGIFLVNRFQQIIPGSTDFNIDSVNTAYNLTSYNVSQIAIIVPAPGQSGLYYIFHTGLQTFPNNVIQPSVLSYSTVDMNMNGGSGQMILKQQPVVSIPLSFSSLQAVKHANGRDWWIVVHQYNSNSFISSLVTPSGIQPSILSSTGPIIETGSNGQSTFSPDGTRYAYADNERNYLAIFSFDRCTGIFTYDTIVRKSVNASGINFSGCSFSPNNQFLYASDLMHLYQYDVTVTDIPSSEKLIATADLVPDPFLSYFNHHCSGPDGKIYFSTGNSCAHLHVINEPNLADTNCNFVQHQQKIINYGNTVPNFPNYRLGAMGGSVCDSLPTIIANEANLNKKIKVYPNPASTSLFIESENISSDYSQLEITSIDGKTLLQEEFHSKKEIDISSFPEGIYFISIKHENYIEYSYLTVAH